MIDELIENMVEATSIRFGFEELYQKILKLDRWTNKRCGNCDKWMCCNCPKEYNVKGRNKGPSMNEFGCELFIVKSYQIKYRQEEVNEILKSKYIKYFKEDFLKLHKVFAEETTNHNKT